MRPSRSFRPFPLAALEDRVVLSSISSAVTQLVAQERKAGVDVRRVGLSAAEIAQSNNSDVSFGFSPSETLQSSIPVAEQVTTTYNVGTPQTETVLEVPNLTSNSVTTYKTINLRNNGGTETVVQTETYSGGAVPLTGNNNTIHITTTLPNGTVQTTSENEVITGPKTVRTATVTEPGTGTETWTSVSIKHGATTTTSKTTTEPDGTIEHEKTTTTHHGEFDTTARSTTTKPSDSEILVSASATNIIRIPPPSS